VRYDYECGSCGVFELEKSISDPHPEKCPHCGGPKPGRFWGKDSAPSIVHPGRPTWAYNDCLGYKTATHNGTTVKVDPTKHGSLSSWDCPGEVVKRKKEKRRKKR
jgi:putative FmdB family regulatory protein